MHMQYILRFGRDLNVLKAHGFNNKPGVSKSIMSVKVK